MYRRFDAKIRKSVPDSHFAHTDVPVTRARMNVLNIKLSTSRGGCAQSHSQSRLDPLPPADYRSSR